MFRKIVLAALAAMVLPAPLVARASCASPANAIEAENCLTGTPQSKWDIPSRDGGDSTIQGFATSISVNQGGTINFKINTPASAYTIQIFRMGYYQGNGARLVTTITPSAKLPQSQPACLTDDATALIDCGNWAVSASWAVPSTAVSGIYFAKLTRSDTGGTSHIVFVVRNDSSHSAILFQASDTTWQAYNDYGGESFYSCGVSPPVTWNSDCRAYKLSYNRPFHTRTYEIESWVFNSEYPMIRWLEANGYDVTYSTDTDSDQNGPLILNHKVFLSNGHDEYWSQAQRANVEAARAAGVHLAFLSSNTLYWKTRWENSIDSSGTPYRTLVCYKETWANAVIDPADPPTWTGTWRDPRFSPPGDGGRPENALLGTISRYVGGLFTPDSISVPQADGQMRFWRNTSVARLSAGQTATLALNTIGEEVEADEDNGYRPAGLFHLSDTPLSTNVACLLDYGSVAGACNMVHSVTLYRHSSGALVLSTGTYHWSWGLDVNHDPSSNGFSYATTPDANMQQATVNFLADMGVQPATLQSGLVAASASTDTTSPTSTITAPTAGSSFATRTTVNITGTATDSGGVVAGVEVSTDGGVTWHPATGRGSWSFSWVPSTAGSATIRSRAVDDSGNLETPSAGVTVSVVASPPCSLNCSIWQASTVPGTPDAGPDSSVEVGMAFRSDLPGRVTGIRFYKGSGNTGTHVGSLWSSSGTLLASATFSGETASGWQQVNFSSPVSISANTVYVASYHTTVGHYSDDEAYFSTEGVDSPPLHAVQDGASQFNGVFAYGSTSSFPGEGWNASNYWVDVVFTPSGTATLSTIAVTPAAPSISTSGTQQFTATGSYSDGSNQNLTSAATWTSSKTSVATVNATGLASAVAAGTTTVSATYNSVVGSTTLTVLPGPLTISTNSLPGTLVNASYSATLAASGGTPPYSWSIPSGLPPGLSLNASTGVISGKATTAGSYSFTVNATDSASGSASASLSITVTSQATIWSASTVPGTPDSGPDSAVELGVEFRSDVAGKVTGIRFYKGTGNTGTHVGNLWSSSGTKLASATFSGETASGWQQVTFSTPVSITANTVYVASYHTSVGHYADDQSFFATSGTDNPPLHALQNGSSGMNGVYAYGSASAFPNQTWNSSNYWVDVVFVAGQ
ncbi:MAG TPA: DUF4082 domain-containing protein [Anaeromyxobacter sp.]|nr:DUF4082 domain-containing protein [Anaeromyxobacter sp.]